LIGQNPIKFFSESSYEEAQLNANQKKIITTVKGNKHTKNVTVVKVKKLKESLVKDALTVSLAGENITVKSKRFEYFGKDDYIWSGELIGRSGYMLLTTKPEGIMGAIQFDDKFFLLQPLKNNFCLLVEHDISNYEKAICPIEQTPQSNGFALQQTTQTLQNPCTLSDGTFCPATIDVLLLITPEAINWITQNMDFWGQVLYIPLLQAYTNLALQNSGISNKQIRVRAVNFNTQFSNSNSITSAIEDLIANTQAQNLRNLYKADLVVAITNNNYNIGGTPYIGQYGTLELEDARSYAIVEVQNSLGGLWSFPHEIGHLLGTRHNRPNDGIGDDNDPSCGHGFRFTDGTGVIRKTMMAVGYQSEIDRTILHYSNPSITYNNAATGSNVTGQEANNAKVIRNTGCIVQNFRPSPELDAYISYYGDICNTLYLNAIVSPAAPGLQGQPPYNYEWFMTPNSMFDDNPAYRRGTGSTISISNPGTSIVWIHLRVTSNDGFVKVVSTNFDGSCNNIYYLTQGSTNQNTLVNVYPNPSNGYYNLEFDIKDELSNTLIDIVDFQGRNIKNIKNEVFTKGFHAFKIDLSNIPTGFYTLKLQNKQQFNVVKLIKL
jgi:hypothetical protein